MEGPTDTCFVPGSGDARAVPDVLLGPLADNGGQTRTHALLPGSSAIDAALDSDCPSADQRGAPRPADGDLDGTAGCDVGAFEVEAPTIAAIPALRPGGQVALALLLVLAAVAVLRQRA